MKNLMRLFVAKSAPQNDGEKTHTVFMKERTMKLVEESKKIKLDPRSKYLRQLVLQGLQGACKGHIGSALSFIEIVRVLYDHIMRYRVEDPLWVERDRFILSKGHGCLGLYAVLADKGFFPTDELKTYTLKGSRLGGCCEIIAPGIEATTGALGHGLSVGIGMAMGASMRGRSNKVYVLLGDGEMGEGSVWEAALCASKYKLSNLITIIDYNKVQLAGFTQDISCLESLTDKWRSFGFEPIEVNGHDVNRLRGIFERSFEKPTVVICHTVKGKGISFAEDSAQWHWKSKIDDELVNQMSSALEEY